MSIDPVNLPALIAARPLVVAVLLPMLLVGLVAYGVYELLRSRGVPAGGAGGTAVASSPAGPPPAPTAAVTILDERFARGEIDAEEYVQRRTLLSPGAAPVSVDTAPPVSVGTAPPAGPDPAAAVVADEATSEQPATTVEAADDQPEGQHPS